MSKPPRSRSPRRGRGRAHAPERPAIHRRASRNRAPQPTMANRPADPVRVARWGLFVLTFVNLFNYLDRFILAAVVESLKKPFPAGLGLSDTELGALATGFILVYMLTSPVFGRDQRRAPAPVA